MSLPFRLKMAKQKAEALLRDEGLGTLPIDPFAIAASRQIVVQPKPDTADGVSYESFNFPGRYIRHYNNLLYTQPVSTTLDRQDATFYKE